MLLLPNFVNYDVSLVQQSFTSAKHNHGEPAYQLRYCGKEDSVQSDAIDSAVSTAESIA